MKRYKRARLAAKAKGREKPPIPSYIGECIMLISKRLSNKGSFASYSYKDEMVGDGIENAIQYGIESFDPDRFTNPFAYFTQIIHWAFVRRIHKEKRFQYVKLRLGQDQQLTKQLHDNSFQPDKGDEQTGVLIREFEEKLLGKKHKSTTASSNGVFDKFVDEGEDDK